MLSEMSENSQGGSAKKQMRVKFRQIALQDLEIDQGDKFFERGQFGEVKKAIWNKQEVAVKYFTSPDRKGGFNEELKNLSLLQNHECIVKMHGACISEHPFIVLEFAPLSLEKVIHECKKLYRYSSDHTMNWSYQMAVGLEFIHSVEILHRDIKPSNVLLFDQGRVLKLCDFGTAKKLETTLTNAVGTIRYMAPEVIKGQHYTNSCDVFSFGIVVWEILSRRRPTLPGTNKGTHLSILYAMASGARPAKLSNIPKALAEMIDHCWKAEPELRPTMSEIRQKLSYLCKYIEMKKPLIIRRQNQLPAMTLDLQSKSPAQSEGIHQEEQIKQPLRSHDPPDAGGMEGPLVIPPLTNIAATDTSSPDIASATAEMGQIRISPIQSKVAEFGEFRHRTVTESVIQELHSDRVSPNMLRKQVSTPESHQFRNFSNVLLNPLNPHTDSRLKMESPESKHCHGGSVIEERHAHQQSAPHCASPPQHGHMTSPPIFQPRFPQANKSSSYFTEGLEHELQPILPNPAITESLDVYQQYKIAASELINARVERDQLLEERSKLDNEIVDDQQRLKTKENIQRDHFNKLNQKERLMDDLKSLQDTYARLRKDNVEHMR